MREREYAKICAHEGDLGRFEADGCDFLAAGFKKKRERRKNLMPLSL